MPGASYFGNIIQRFIRPGSKGLNKEEQKAVNDIKKKNALERVIIKNAVNNAVNDILYNDADKRETMINMLKEINEHADIDKNRMKKIGNILERSLIKHTADNNIIDFLMCNTNEEKAVLLLIKRNNMKKNEFTVS